MGFTTKGKETKRKTYHLTRENRRFVDDISENWPGWDKSDVVNRALQYYRWKLNNGELDDPRAPDDKMDKQAVEDKDWSLRDLLG